MTSSMRAAVVTAATGPGAVEILEVPAPTPRAGELLVAVEAVGVSFPDLLLSQGRYQVRPEPPFVLGLDFAGTALSAAPGLAEGQRVAGIVSHGAAAERVCAPANLVFPLPDSFTYDEGAALPLNYLTAHFALVHRGQLRAGETVLVHGAAGGVGTATVQLAHALGARVIAVVSTEEKAAFARAHGADEAVLATDFKEQVAGLTGGRGVDLIVDVVGGHQFTDSLRSLAPLGRLLVVGFAAGTGIPEVRVNRLLLGNIDVRGVGWGAYALTTPGFVQQQWRDLMELMEQHAIKPPIGTTYALAQFAQALTDLDERRGIGKSIVKLS